jgi:hypothetical protein
VSLLQSGSLLIINLSSEITLIKIQNIGGIIYWITATAKVAAAKILAIDGNSDHFNGKLIQVIKYQQQ